MKTTVAAASYSAIAERYDDRDNEGSFWGELARQAYEAIALTPEHRLVVDVGCGTGLALRQLSQRAPSSTRIVGVEPAPRMRNIAEQRNADRAAVAFRDGAFEALPFEDAEVDYLYSIWAFHWVTDVRRAAAEIRRVVKGRGEIDLWFVGMNNGREFAQKTREVLGRFASAEARLRAASMTASLDRKTVEALFEGFDASGLTIVEETATHHATLDAHWAWQVRSEAFFSVVSPEARPRFEGELRAALAGLEEERGIPYTRHSFHVRYRHIDPAIFEVPAWIGEGGRAGAEYVSRPVSLCALGAPNAEDLTRGLEHLRGMLEREPDGARGDIHAVMGAGESHRLAFVAADTDALRRGLRIAAEGRVPPLGSRAALGRRPVIAFVFSGQGGERTGMGRELFAGSGTFRAAIEACARHVDPLCGCSLVDVVSRDADEPIEDDVLAKVTLFAVEYALARLWLSWGVRPSVVVGHSLGEYAAACIAGVFSLEDALSQIVGRGRAMREHAAPGSMAAVRADAEQIARELAEHAGDVVVSAVNAPENIVLSGDTAALERLCGALEARGIKTKRLQTMQPFHSPRMRPAEQALRRVCERASYSAPKIAFVSTVEGGHEADVACPEYWVRHMLQPVSFRAAVETLRRRGTSCYIEVGPGATLTSFIEPCLGKDEAVCLPSMNGASDTWPTLLASVGAVFACGAPLDWRRFSPSCRHRVLDTGACEGATSDVANTATVTGWARSLEAATRGERLGVARHAVRAEVEKLVGRELDERADASGLMALGLTSIQMVALARRLSERLERRVPDMLTFSRSTIDALARFVLEELGFAFSGNAVALPSRGGNDREPIAIVGVGCRLPGGVIDLQDLWAVLDGAKDTAIAIPDDRWGMPARAGGASEKPPVARASFLDDVSGFDAPFFGISPREATQMDPTHRMLLEVCWEALESAAVLPETLAGTPAALFVGIGPSEYERPASWALEGGTDAYAGLGAMPSVGVGRVSHVLGLRGPCLAVDTACSSSLVALHLACESLRAGHCSMALAGGVSLMLSPRTFEWLSRSGALAADGRCKTFSEDANGYGRGEGCAMLVLERLGTARAGGHAILGLIRGSALNHDGASGGLTVPSGAAQESVLQWALDDAGCSAASIGYVEAHGTGTPLGDPIEIGALSAVYGAGRSPDAPLLLGSVKTNLGHLEYAAGVAGVLKVLACLKAGRIPAHLHASTLSSRIDWKRIGVEVARAPVPWPKGDSPRRAGVSSFGISGTNAHVIVEEAPSEEEPARAEPWSSVVPVVVSGKSESALRAQAGRLREHLASQGDVSLVDLGAALATGRTHFGHRASLLVRDRAELERGLESLWRGEELPSLSTMGTGRSGKLAMLFSGQGSQRGGMGRELYETFDVFRDSLDEVFSELDSGQELKALMFAPERAPALEPTANAQPALFAMHVGLYRLLSSWGVEPDLLLGHSVGELAAAHVAGVFSLRDGCRLVQARGRLMQSLPQGGAMVALQATEAEVLERLAAASGRVSIAALNGPCATVVSGEVEEARRVAATFEALGRKATWLRVSHAFHSAQMDGMLTAFGRVAETVSYGRPQRGLVSSVTGRRATDEEMCSADYWVDQVRQTVRFADGLRTLEQQGVETYLELGPQAVLSALGIAAMSTDGHGRSAFVPSQGGAGHSAIESLFAAVGALHARGHHVDFGALFAPLQPRRAALTPLPTYAFQRAPYWPPPPAEMSSHPARAVDVEHPLLGRRLRSASEEIRFESELNIDSPAWLADHEVGEGPVFPGTAYLEMMLSAARKTLGDASIRDVAIAHPMRFTDALRAVECIVAPDDGRGRRIRIASAEGLQSDDWTEHASGHAARQEEQQVHAEGLDAIRARLTEGRPVEPFYEESTLRGIRYGERFRLLHELWVGDGEALGALRVDGQLERELASYAVHPVLLDGAWQVIAAVFSPPGNDAWLPFGIEHFVSRRRAGAATDARYYSHVRRRPAARARAHDIATFDVTLFDPSGRVVAHVQGLSLRRASARRIRTDWLYELSWLPRANVGPGGPTDGARSVSTEDVIAAAQRVSVPYPALPVADVELLSAAYAARALRESGWQTNDPPRSIEALRRDLGISPKQERLLRALLEGLSRAGWLAEDGGAWSWTRDGAVMDPDRLCEALSREHPALVAELRLLARCGQHLRKVLAGQLDGVEVLFPGGDSTWVAPLYRGESPANGGMNQLLEEALSAVVEASRAGHRVRILELGGGTGGTTTGLLEKLAHGGYDVEYVFTDVSPAFTVKAKERYAAYDFFDVGVFDIDRVPQDRQDRHLSAFDVVIAANVLHATPDVQRTLRNVRSLLRPGGFLLLLETTGRRLWLDSVFGLVQGWWAFTDTALRQHALLSRADWCSALLANGFQEPAATAPEGMDRHGLSPQTLLVARADQDDATRHAPPISGDEVLIIGHGDLVERLRARAAGAAPRGARTVVYVADDTAAYASPADEAYAQSTQLLVCAQAMIEQPDHDRALWIVTRGAQAVGAGRVPVRLGQSALWGLARSIDAEHPELRVGVLDLDANSVGIEADADAVEAAMRGEIAEKVCAVRGGRWYVASFVRTRDVPSGRSHGAAALTVAHRGNLDTLALEPRERRAPAANEVELRVRAAGLNFRDVLSALDLYPGEVGPLGDECAGEVVRVGSEVTKFAPGDQVVAISEGTFGDYVTLDARAAARAPRSLPPHVAATLPVNYVTAFHALAERARIRPGDRVLIHSAAGGTGLAAAKLALAAGAEVYATAARSKWPLLEGLGVRRLFASRSLSFADEIRGANDGRGVDVVLNALSGDFIARGLSLLEPGGRFIEMGKTKIWSAAEVLAVRPDVEYHVVDLLAWRRENPADIGRMLEQEIVPRIERGELTPSPYRLFSLHEARDAFRAMQDGSHVGKLVFRTTDVGLSVHSDRSYLVTGGLGGLGLAMARRLVERGARHLVLVGRRDASASAEQELSSLRARGAVVTVRLLDVANRDWVDALFREIDASMPPLAGVIHGAGVLADRTLHRQDAASFTEVFGPKVSGGWALHENCKDRELDFFVLFSSSSGALGAAGQSNHAAANAFLDALARQRRAEGLPALSIGWGAWASIGAAASARVRERVRAKGFRPMAPEEALRAFDALLDTDRAHVVVADIDWAVWLAEQGGDTRPFEHLRRRAQATETAPRPPESLRETLPSIPAGARRAAVEAHVRREVAAVLGLGNPTALDRNLGFFNAGMDSLTSVELRARLQKSVGAPMPMTLTFDHPTIAALSEYLAREVLGIAPSAASVDGQDEQDEENLDLAPEVEIGTLLDERLASIEERLTEP